ncbi:MAG: SUMF1/EgtB/PvdO family nonheme iron enzyme [Bacteroidales bacterium]|nr:SUMF1/EgtB/PvdO family nonheme iron enzyme [Bacteroidales bacterium]
MRQYLSAAVKIAAFLLALSACSKIENEPIADEPAKGTCKMFFEGRVAGYDNTVLRDGISTKAASSWQDGDKVYIVFYKGTEIVVGEAQYSVADGWTITFDGDLSEGKSLKCEVRFFVNPTFANAYTVNLNPHSEIYEDVNAEYDYTGGNLRVSASLVPKVGRIRFTGNDGEMIFISGIETYSNYAPATNSFSSTKGMFRETIGSDGSTVYIYGFCSYADRKVGVVGSDCAYTKYFAESIFKQGESGYMAIPTTSAHNGWKSGFYVTLGDVEFKMIAVPGYEGGFYLIGETEVTNAIYNMSSSVSNPMTPKSFSYSSDCTSYISRINYATNLNFYVPDLSEWQFAAKGGVHSQGYTYSGSDNPNDVAWYYGNSGNALHPVKQLAPNELGLYDMSGNISEWINENGNWSLCGGDYRSYEKDITVTSNGFFYQYGLRLALKCE